MESIFPGSCPAIEKTFRDAAAPEQVLCIQALHVGPADQVGETLEKMKSCAAGHELFFHGRHHEIYLSDPKRIPAERRRTIVRMPVR
ncbi:MAG: GyrI-like domain-containing protein [Kiritimatiellae bacterium]|nr:GyrI-like domain-containing protein [Kiritimatiellia bacterium]